MIRNQNLEVDELRRLRGLPPVSSEGSEEGASPASLLFSALSSSLFPSIDVDELRGLGGLPAVSSEEKAASSSGFSPSLFQKRAIASIGGGIPLGGLAMFDVLSQRKRERATLSGNIEAAAGQSFLGGAPIDTSVQRLTSAREAGEGDISGVRRTISDALSVASQIGLGGVGGLKLFNVFGNNPKK